MSRTTRVRNTTNRPRRVVGIAVGALVAALLLSACSASPDNAAPAASETSPLPTPEPTPRIEPTPRTEPTPTPGTAPEESDDIVTAEPTTTEIEDPMADDPDATEPTTGPAVIRYDHLRGMGGWQAVLVTPDGVAVYVDQVRGTPPLGEIVRLRPEDHRQLLALTGDPDFMALPEEIDDGTEYQDRSSIVITTLNGAQTHTTRATGRTPALIDEVHQLMQDALANGTTEAEGDQATLHAALADFTPGTRAAKAELDAWINQHLIYP